MDDRRDPFARLRLLAARPLVSTLPAQPMEASLGIGDARIGLLTGRMFSVVYISVRTAPRERARDAAVAAYVAVLGTSSGIASVVFAALRAIAAVRRRSTR